MEIPVEGLDLTAGSEPASPPEQSATPEASTDSVLIGIADPDLRQLIEQAMGKRRMAVTDAATERELLDRLRAVRPAIVALDAGFADGRGWATLQALKDDPETRAVPVLLLHRITEGRAAIRQGCAEYATKPLDRTRLLACLDNVRNGAGPGAMLIVDDDPSFSEMLRRSVEKEGWTVSVVPDGAAALDQLRGSMPDLVILDVDMPGMDGLECLRRLRADPSTALVPVLVMSNKDMSADERVRLGGYVEHPLYGRPDDADSLSEAAAVVLRATQPAEKA
jgi:CheY-like chemotaxis protein